MGFLDILWPRVCLGCNILLPSTSQYAYLCIFCAANIPELKNQSCIGCGNQRADGSTCHKCRPDWHITACYAVAPYGAPPIERIVTTLKYRFIRDVANDMAALMAKHCGVLAKNKIITFVPTSTHRQRWRGFNQSELIAKKLSEITNTRCIPLLTKRKGFGPQVKTAGRGERLQNIQGAHAILANEVSRVSGQNIILIDDVVTTGATLNDCARALKEAGVRSITGLCFAKAEFK